MGIDRDPVYAIILKGFDDNREAGWEMVESLSELSSIGDESILEANHFYAELKDPDGNYWIYGHLNDVMGEYLCFETSPGVDPQAFLDAIKEAGYEDNIDWHGHEVSTS